MSFTRIPKPRRALRLGSAVLGAVLVALMVGVTPTSAVVNCNFAGATATVTLGSGDSATIIRSGAAISVNGAACGGATVNNTDLIDVDGAGGNETVTINLSGGDFAPGATDEGDGKSEIEWTIDLAGGADELVIRGSNDRDRIALGTAGINLNARLFGDPQGDTDVDVTSLTGVEAYTVNGGPGSDLVSGRGEAGAGGVFPSPLTLRGQGSTDNLAGGSANDTISGGLAQDILRGLGGDDELDGGGEFDTASYGDAAIGVTVDLTIAGPQNTVGAGNDTLISVENLLGSPQGDTLTGNALGNILDGFGGNDTLNGNAGADWLGGGPGDDTKDGGAGADIAVYIAAVAGVTVDLAIAGPQNTAGDGTDTLLNMEGIWGSENADQLFGDEGNNTFRGGGLGDEIHGRDGTDTVDYSRRPTKVIVSLDNVANDGAPGEGDNVMSDVERIIGTRRNDLFMGAPGVPNAFLGGFGRDRVSYKKAGAKVNASLAKGTAADGGGAIDTFKSIEHLTGTPFADTLIGKAGRNILKGLGGRDTLNGLNGNDKLVGGAKKDVLRGGNHKDVALGGAGGDRLLGQKGNDTLRGGKGKDTLKGGARRDKLFGNAGNDTLNGGADVDRCRGGAGVNTLVNCEI